MSRGRLNCEFTSKICSSSSHEILLLLISPAPFAGCDESIPSTLSPAIEQCVPLLNESELHELIFCWYAEQETRISLIHTNSISDTTFLLIKSDSGCWPTEQDRDWFLKGWQYRILFSIHSHRWTSLFQTLRKTKNVCFLIFTEMSQEIPNEPNNQPTYFWCFHLIVAVIASTNGFQNCRQQSKNSDVMSLLAILAMHTTNNELANARKDNSPWPESKSWQNSARRTKTGNWLRMCSFTKVFAWVLVRSRS
jgi:hypothetical protein